MIISKNLNRYSMKTDNVLDDKSFEKFKYFSASLKNSNWALSASEKTIDSLFDCASELEVILPKEEKYNSNDISFESKCNVNSNKPLDILIESIIKNQSLNEQLTLYAIEKYILFYSKDDFYKLLEKILSEVEFRKHAFNLIEKYPNVDLDFFMLNNFLNDILHTSDLKSKILNALRSQTLVLLKAIKYGDFFNSQILMDEMILCLESQTDLRLWFFIVKIENLDTVLDLCVLYISFFTAVLKFFDKFADEVESTFDEELNIQYSHVNLDFEDFVEVLKFFLKKKSLKKVISEYLDCKTLSDKNFCFWVDVKACL